MLFRYWTWAFDDLRLVSGIYFIHGRLVGTALVHSHFFGHTTGFHGFFNEPQGRGAVAPRRVQA
jgi:hypothetical protein